MTEKPLDVGDLSPGTLFGRYRIERFLGRGGMGAVYAAEQLDDGRQVALKVLSTTLDSPEDRERFLREGRSAASVNHPSTVYVYRTEEIAGTPTIAMELVDGGTLEEKVQHRGPLPAVEAVRDILSVVDGLEAAHRVGLLHRDVKPANCFVGRGGEVKVGDFGLSRPVDRADEVRLTRTGLFLGTPVFSSPEQLMGDALDVRADIYAVGATLYYLLSGALPFESDNAVRLVAVVLGGSPVPLSARRVGLPSELVAVVMKCLERKREDRFPDYASLRSALTVFLPLEEEPAPLARRIAAGLADATALSVFTTPIAVAVGVDLMNEENNDVGLMTLATLLTLPVYVAWYGGIEGRLGWSPGKWLARLRVVRSNGGAPGWRVGGWRAGALWAPSMLGAAAWGALDRPVWKDLGPMGVATLGVLLLFLRARPSNGWLGEHDRITGTRVIRAPRPVVEARQNNRAAPRDRPVRDDAERMGPYTVLDEDGPAPGVVVGYDRELARRVWLVQRDADAPAVSAAERTAVRSTCLRWLGGRRAAGDSWDAYAALDGESFQARSRRPATWHTVHGWLSQLADELEARGRDQGAAESLSTNHVWITSDDSAVILPFTTDPAAPVSVTPLLQQVALQVETASEGAPWRMAWPLRGQRLLAALSTGGAGSVRERLRASLGDGGGFGRRHRLLLWLGMWTPAAVLAGFLGLGGFLAWREQPVAIRVAPLVDYVQSRRSQEQANMANRELVAVYLAAEFGDFVRTATAEQRAAALGLTARDWKTADSIVAAHPVVSPVQLASARLLVDSTWRGQPPDLPGRWGTTAVIVLIVALGIPVVVGGFVALFARRGPVLHVLGLEVVNRRGQPAGRMRLLWRHIVGWTPALLCLAGLLVVYLGNAWRQASGWVTLAGVAVVSLVAVVPGLRTPQRGLAERLSGTVVVPE